MKKIIAIPALLFGLLLSVNASAAPIEINDNFFEVFDPLRIADYQVNLEVGGTESFDFGFEFIDSSHAFWLDIDVPLGFIGVLEYCTSDDPGCTGLSYLSGGLVAGESTSLFVTRARMVFPFFTLINGDGIEACLPTSPIATSLSPGRSGVSILKSPHLTSRSSCNIPSFSIPAGMRLSFGTIGGNPDISPAARYL